jgi:hypothetical protein
MGWDPSVLRKYNTTGHFRLLNQVRAELKGNPLVRPKDGQTVGAANRSRNLTRAIESRAQGGGSARRSRSSAQAAAAQAVVVVAPSDPAPEPGTDPGQDPSGSSSARTFRERLNAIDMR